MPYLWDDKAWADYRYWATQDKKTLRKINALLKEIYRCRESGKLIGKAELLKHSAAGLCSVRIDQANRLTYKVEGDVVRIVSCKGHYAD